MIGVFLAAIGVPTLILTMAYLMWLAEKEPPCPCDWCEQNR